MIRSPQPIHLDDYRPEIPPASTLFGLPKEVVFCRTCVTSNQKPNSEREYQHTSESQKKTQFIGTDGICNPCRVAEQKSRGISWSDRDAQLKELCARYRSKDGSYDVLVPGSGGKDSFYAAHILKYRYGMHPLTVTWAPNLYTTWGWKNFQSWIGAGFDNILITPNGRVHRLVTRLATEILFHPFQPFMMGQMYLAPRIAKKYGIELVFYGENAAEYGNPIEETLTPDKDKSYFAIENREKTHIGGVSAKSLVDDFGLEWGDLDHYLPMDLREAAEAKINVQYLGYYLKWHPQTCYYYSVEHGGFEAAPERSPGTYSKYASIDDKMDDFNFYTAFVKFGLGRATHDASQEIRNGDITRDEGVALVKRFDGEFPERFAKEVFEYLSLNPKEFPSAAKLFEHPTFDREYFEKLTDRFRSPHLWMNEDGRWKLRRAVWHA
jgi:N-acetyl sugar amidotransferase